MRSLLSLISRVAPPPESIEDNAHRFVRVVARHAHDHRFIECYPHQGYRGVRTEMHGWTCMVNPKWRALVLALLEAQPVTGAVFDPPDNLDGWTFHARSTVPVPHLATLDLKDLIP